MLVETKYSKMLRVCIDFRYLNRDAPKDEYIVLIIDMLINQALGHHFFSFLW